MTEGKYEWQFAVPVGSTLARDRLVANYTVTAVNPAAALVKAQVQLDGVYGPGKWLAAKAVMESGKPNRIVVEKVR